MAYLLPNELWPMLTSTLCALALTPLLINVRPRTSADLRNPQSLHSKPTSRLGGVMIYFAYVGAIAPALALNLAPAEVVLSLLVSALPVVLVALREDIARCMPPWSRLLGAVIAASLAAALVGGIVPRVDQPHIDSWLTYLPIVLPLTCFMVAGACNAINLIDGAHGLAGGTAVLMFVGLAIVAAWAGDTLVFIQAASMAGSVVGFLFWNYPRGRIFMGDAGAYFIGFMYAELAMQLISRNPDVSAWFVIMLAAYPIVETLVTIYRRKVLQGTASMAPDALHLHSLLYQTRRGEYAQVDKKLHRANARIAPRMWLHGAFCFAFAVSFFNDTSALIGGLLCYAALYLVHYRIVLARRLVQRDSELQTPP
jgi:UDP-GlcNAc:undecaprenyl-phosphate GlcNAc-1-phosphate transferase